jgi:hypothetical protein
MEVCDASGDKIGSIARVHHMSEAHEPASEGVLDEIMEVKTGFLGFGKRLYVPLSDVQEVFRETAFLSRTKAELESLGYQTKPTHLS